MSSARISRFRRIFSVPIVYDDAASEIAPMSDDGIKVIDADLLNNEYTFTRSFDQNSKVGIRHLQGCIVEITVSDQSSSATFLLYSNGAISTPHFRIQKDFGGEFKGYINNREILTNYASGEYHSVVSKNMSSTKQYCYKDYPTIIANGGYNGFGTKKTVEQLAREVLNGKCGNGDDRKKLL